MKANLRKSSVLPALRDVTRIGDETRHRGLCSPEVEHSREPWCSTLSPCPLLPDFGIRHMGIVEAAVDYRFERTNPRDSLFLASLRGVGYAGTVPAISLLPAGYGVLLPRGRPSVYLNASMHSWCLVWICFDRPELFIPGAEGGNFPLDTLVFHHTMEAVITCWDRYRNPATTLRMIAGLMNLVMLHLHIRPEMDHFHKAWQTVAADFGAAWNVARVASLAACSQERFRRLCWSELGTSPMKHLTKLRLCHARMMLSSTSQTIEEISANIGYSDAYSLSHAFKQRFGVSPREFRNRQSAGDLPVSLPQQTDAARVFPG